MNMINRKLTPKLTQEMIAVLVEGLGPQKVKDLVDRYVAARKTEGPDL